MKFLRSILLTLPLIAVTLGGCRDMGTDPSGGFGTETRRIINRIFFLSNRETPRSMQVFSMNPDGTDMRRHTYPNDSATFYYAAPSPGLTRMAVVWNFYDLRHKEFPSLGMVDTSGNFLYPLVDYCEPMDIAWSPRGDRIGFTRPATYFGGRDDAYFVSARGGSITRVTNFGVTNLGNGFIDTSSIFLQWVDDNTILVRLVVDSTYDSSGIEHHNFTVGIFEIELNGRISRSILVSDSITYFGASLSPPKTRLVLAYSNRNGHTGVRLANADGSSQFDVVPPLSYYRNEGGYLPTIRWSPDGSLFGFSAYISQSFRPSTGKTFIVSSTGIVIREVLADTTNAAYVVDWR